MRFPVCILGRAEADLTHQYRWYMDPAGVAVAERFLAAFNATTMRCAGCADLSPGPFVRVVLV